ncbi:tetratricopeptide repeat protein 12 isoform X2 [Misgurnus anguillicaudatus]|uniref:tetratricopeptide repeat protein 12 isoform X2 n=1 Tax=Misgurnus anguillicaudatus TaxID=75329 RepID=UPI003CCF9B54
MALQDSDDFERFLSNVDQISELVKELNSSDGSCQEVAFKKADQFIASLEEMEPCKTKINKTAINTNPSSENSPLNIQCESAQNPENFIRILEKDAEERSQRRKMNEDKANALRENGNKAFARGDYETAVRFYTEGLDQLRDMQALYTNRAQAFIKLKRYKEAISDCEWALRCNERCIKAYVHMGKSHLALKNFSESRICYQKILEIEPQGETMVKGTGQTLFRLNNGFSIINDNNIVKSCLSQNFKEPYAMDLCLSVLKLWRIVCCENELNQQLLIECPNARQYIIQLLASPIDDIYRECLNLLSMYSQTPYGRELLINNLHVNQMAETLMGSICRDTSSLSSLAVLESLATENKFKIQSRDNFIAIFALPFEHLLSNIVTANHKTLASLISVIGSLALDDVIGIKMANREEFWRCSLHAMEHHIGCECESVLYPLLGLMINLASHPFQITQELAVLTSSRCLELLCDPHGGIITRVAGLLSALLPTSRAATQEVVQNGIVKRLLKILKVGGEMSSRYSIKALAVCTASIPQACEELVKLDKRLHTLRKLLGGIDEVVAGNAALCIGHCLEVEGAARGLLGTDCVSLLLRHAAGDAKRVAVKQNAAITLGKLCKAEPRHMVKLMELHGLEILHACARLIT